MSNAAVLFYKLICQRWQASPLVVKTDMNLPLSKVLIFYAGELAS
jgi:hypothetical protein